ncbi:lipoxygenase family protein [Moellerella wisconsensis]|uniref:lipoxygenase family protein n=1 Tax=Moellerella wisconsensis TaxID=158849 RepID=UPI00069C41C8|nr:lipoxygenase family protein [Moellerella wisconsensis]
MKNTDNDEYKWSTNIAPLIGIPMYDKPPGIDVPIELRPRAEYDINLELLVNKVKNNFKSVFNDILNNDNDKKIKINNLVDDLIHCYASLINNKNEVENEKIQSIWTNIINLIPKENKELGLDLYNNLFKIIVKPFVADYLHNDDLFAYQRIAGANPVALIGVSDLPSNFPLSNEQYQFVMGENDSLSNALKQNRIYMLNYSYLSGVVAEDGYTKPEGSPGTNPMPGYSYAAIALFSVSLETKELTAVAIQCGQDPDDNNEMFLATEDVNSDRYWAWQRAKYVIQAADESEHQLSTHLGLTHLLMEAFALATLRKLPKDHPLHRLLITHFEATNRINHNATLALLGEHQFVDMLFAAPLENMAKAVIDIRLSYDFKAHYFPEALKQRKVDDINALPSYPYRDDGLLIWHAIKDWVREYINIYYVTSTELSLDKSFQAWVKDIIDNGKVKGFTQIKTKDELIDTLTMIIFTSSAQHAAVNYSQPGWLMYAPHTIGTMAYPKPTSVTGSTQKQWLDMLPKVYRASQKIIIYTLLGELYHGKLGEYIGLNYKLVFNDHEIIKKNGPLDKFRKNLANIQKIIQERNGKRPYPYEYLIPENIPASINI